MLVRLHAYDNSVSFVAEALCVYISEHDHSKLNIDYADGTHQAINGNDQDIDHVSIGDSELFVRYGNEWKHSKGTSKFQLNG